MTFNQLLSTFAIPHALFGTVALATFWTAGLSKKGSPLHKAVGKIYLLAMIGIIVTALPLALSQALKGQWVGAAFLGYLAILVSHACRNAWLAIRRKRDFERYTGTGYRVSVGLLGISGVAVSVLGMVYGAWLLIIFGLLGPLSVLSARSLILNGPRVAQVVAEGTLRRHDRQRRGHAYRVPADRSAATDSRTRRPADSEPGLVRAARAVVHRRLVAGSSLHAAPGRAGKPGSLTRSGTSAPYSSRCLLRCRHAPRPGHFAPSRILTVQASTLPVRSVAKRPGHRTCRRLATTQW